MHDIVGLDDYNHKSAIGMWHVVASHVPEGKEGEYMSHDTSVKYLFNEDGHADVLVSGRRG